MRAHHQAQERQTLEHLRRAGISGTTVDHGHAVNRDRYRSSYQMGSAGAVVTTTGGTGGNPVLCTMSGPITSVDLSVRQPSSAGDIEVAIYADDVEITDPDNRPTLPALQGQVTVDGATLLRPYRQAGEWLTFDVMSAGTGASTLAVVPHGETPPERRTNS